MIIKYLIPIICLGFSWPKDKISGVENWIPQELTENHLDIPIPSKFKNELISTIKNKPMSDYVLKFWPKVNVQELKTEKIISELTKSKIIAEPFQFWGKPAFKPGKSINDYFEPILNEGWSKIYFPTIAITISENDYGVLQGEEDFEYIDRKNVISIKGGEAAFEKWDLMCEKLKEITGDEYQGGWEIL